MQILEKKKLYQALLRRDSKYDGRFYFGVVTTGIYCRPICPARPKFENVRFYRSKAEAEVHGFRPCLRCRPDLSPLSPQWRGTEAVVGRALDYIRSSAFDLNEVATKVGMSDRHLRRIFEEHLGTSPMEVSMSYRLHLARQLLSQTQMKIIDVALASGFQSVRRFNDAFAKKYKRSPSAFRKQNKDQIVSNLLTLEIPLEPTFDFHSLLKSFRSHQVFGVDYSDHESYERHLVQAGQRAYFKVRWSPKRSVLLIETVVQDVALVRTVLDKVRRAFDLSHNPHDIVFPKKVPVKLKRAIIAARVQGGFDQFECAVCVILGQLVSTEQGRMNIRKLVETYGKKLSAPPSENLTYDFPRPEDLQHAPLEKLGLTRVRAEAIRQLSILFADKKIDLDYPRDFQIARNQLLEVKGIGAWTAEMIALRCLRDPDAMPASDLIIQRALKKLNLDHQEFSPWRSYLCVAIWNLYAGELSKKKRGKI